MIYVWYFFFFFCVIGFIGSVLKVCCGGEDGRYNVKLNVRCGGKGLMICENLLMYVNWDGIYLIEVVYCYIVIGFIFGCFIKFFFSNSLLFFKF